ncbi:hypothetical protein BD779DRAFT_1790186 [Infundibulicybe gibba]|nr:hypothetical protein BD779DRAFT_1790186 [Infundibulicybe gibba]
MSTPTMGIPLADIELLWSHLKSSQYSEVGALTFYVWDYFLTLPDEVEYFWKGKWTLLRFLFLLNRYHRLVITIIYTYLSSMGNPNRDMCLGKVVTGNITGIMAALIPAVILQIRVHALYGQNKRLIYILSILFCIQVAFILILSSLDLNFSVAMSHKLPTLIEFTPFCNIAVPGYLYLIWIYPIMFDFVLMALAVARAIRYFRDVPKSMRSCGLLIQIFLRDSILVFLISFVLYSANLLMWTLGPHDLYEIVVTWALIIPSVVVNRMLINLRKVPRETYITITGSNILFNPS